MKSARSVGIDIGSGQVKVAVLQRRGGKVQVMRLARVELPSPAENASSPGMEDLSRAIRSALDSAGVRGGDAAYCIPQQSVALRLSRLPGAPSERLGKAATLEAQSALPFPAAEAVSGVQMRPVEGAAETQVLVAAARADKVKQYRAAAAAAGVAPVSMGVASLVAAAMVPAEEAPWLLLDIGAQTTSMNLFADGMPQVSRTLLVGGAHLTRAFAQDLGCDTAAAEKTKREQGLGAVPAAGGDEEDAGAVAEWLSQLAAEMRLLLASWSARGGAAPRRVCLVGGGGKLAGLSARLERALSLPVQPLSLPVLDALGEENSLQFAAAYGMALVGIGAAPTADLLADEVRQAQMAKRRRTRSWTATTACLLLLVGGGLGAHRSWRIHQAEARERAAVARQVSTAQRALRDVRTRKDSLEVQAKALRASLQPKNPWVNVINELARLAPSGVWVTGIELSRGKPLTVRAVAMEPGQAAEYVKALAGSSLLEQVQLSFANDATVGDRHVTQFGISAQVRGNEPEARAKASTTSKKPTAKKPAARETQEVQE